MSLQPPPFVVPPRRHDQWHPEPGYDGVEVDPRFGTVVELMRELNTGFAGARPEGDAYDELISLLERANTLFASYEVEEMHQLVGRRAELPAQGQVFTPVFNADEWDENMVKGRITFGRFHMGGNQAAHGGAISLAFDEVLGKLANVGGRPVARTAYLNVSYRNITPIDTELTLVGKFVGEEGRKRFVNGQILNGDTVCAEAETLFIALLPGQQ